MNEACSFDIRIGTVLWHFHKKVLSWQRYTTLQRAGSRSTRTSAGMQLHLVHTVHPTNVALKLQARRPVIRKDPGGVLALEPGRPGNDENRQRTRVHWRFWARRSDELQTVGPFIWTNLPGAN